MKIIKQKKKFSQAVATVAGNAISLKGYVSVIDVMVGLNWLSIDNLNHWKQGRMPYLERAITASYLFYIIDGNIGFGSILKTKVYQ